MSINWDILAIECLFNVVQVNLAQQKKDDKSETYYLKIDLQTGSLQFRSIHNKIVHQSNLNNNSIIKQ